MNQKILTSFCCFMALCLLAACTEEKPLALEESAPPTPAPEVAPDAQIVIDLGAGEGSKEITLKSDEKFVVRIEGNPTTGYSWVHPATRDFRVAIPDGAEQFVPAEETADGRVGAPGHFEFPFKTVGPGSKKLIFRYERPWEKDVEPARVAELTVTVEEASP
ncbi:protease inhibitor I42 family protein [Kamptonema cortianum]|nr:protease inhibitor I42 family protein [Oscillatoria laete-virens]MDK3156638.1 protease inhibitor I42 family protein [Kamptonema cortianum]MDL5050351.1 protease inhibitor I42 family protein [Oscillatoria amoena NRMC-F 0135]MDL5053377.1 protease inhibitor I42 family protein [Oscillatoria laete-virens NRMC-F 0139]